ncbi:MAG: MFS transporter [Thiotrichales bacterium]|nr:MFS transporter [Thiotrichales bacterium]
MNSKQTLFLSKRFLPLFWVQFLGAFNDNVFKSALVMLIVFRLAENPQQAGLLTTAAAGIFILPFFLLSAFAGNLADTYEKTALIRGIKLAEIVIMLFGGWALLNESLVGLFVLLFLMGAQSAFFGPIKYAILPEHLAQAELTQGNAWFSASTFMAILLGTIMGGWLVLIENGTIWTPGLVIFVAFLGYFASLKVPDSHARPNTIKPAFRLLQLMRREVRAAQNHAQAFWAVLAISWFWFLGAAYLSQIPVMVKGIGGDESVVLLFLAAFSVGIAVGAWLVNHWVPKFSALSALRFHGILLASLSVWMLLSTLAMSSMSDLDGNLMSVLPFLSHAAHDVLLGLFLLIPIVGGIYIVPLYTHLQTHSPEYFRGRMIAVNNIINSFLMVLSSLFFLLGYALGLDVLSIFYGLVVLNLLVALALHRAWLKVSTQKLIEVEV